jgi:uncharacterized protein YlxW (UPF0749 family)
LGESTGVTASSEDVEAPRKSSPLDAVPTAKTIRATLEQWQQAIDERIRAVVPDFSAIHDLQKEVRELKERVANLEATCADKAASHEK